MKMKGQVLQILAPFLREYGTIITSRVITELDPSLEVSLSVTEIGELTLLNKPPKTKELSGKRAIILVSQNIFTVALLHGH